MLEFSNYLSLWNFTPFHEATAPALLHHIWCTSSDLEETWHEQCAPPSNSAIITRCVGDLGSVATGNTARLPNEKCPTLILYIYKTSRPKKLQRQPCRITHIWCTRSDLEETLHEQCAPSRNSIITRCVGGLGSVATGNTAQQKNLHPKCPNSVNAMHLNLSE